MLRNEFYMNRFIYERHLKHFAHLVSVNAEFWEFANPAFITGCVTFCNNSALSTANTCHSNSSRFYTFFSLHIQYLTRGQGKKVNCPGTNSSFGILF